MLCKNRGRRLEVKKIWREKNKDETREYSRKYKKEHPEIYRMANQRRNALKRKLPSTLTVKQWEQIKSDFNNTCAYCGGNHPLAQDHFTPISKGGHYTKENIIPACKSCNSSKSNKDFFDWYPTHESYSPQREQKILNHLNYQDNQQQLSISI